MIKRRRVYDKNNCEFKGRVVGDIVTTEIKGYDGQPVKRIDYTLAVNSNQFNPNAVYFVHCYSLKYFANALEAVLMKGTQLIVYAEYKPKTIAPSKKLNREKSTQPFFEVREFYIIKQPTDKHPINTIEFEDVQEMIMEE